MPATGGAQASLGPFTVDSPSDGQGFGGPSPAYPHGYSIAPLGRRKPALSREGAGCNRNDAPLCLP